MSIYLVQTFVELGEFLARRRRVAFSKRNDLPLEIHHGPRIGLALQRGLSHQFVIDVAQQGVNLNKLLFALQLLDACSRAFVALHRFGTDILAQDTYVFVDMVKEREDDLIVCQR